MKLDVILRVTTKILLPYLLVFALYVHFHADFGAGGGFQAGIVAAGMVILYSIIFGVDTALRVIPLRFVVFMVPLGVLIYGGTGLISFAYNANYLDYSILAEKSKDGHHLGIIMIEVGVLVTVAGTMTTIFYAFLMRGR